MQYELTVEERLALENLRLKRQLLEADTKMLMSKILRKHDIPGEYLIRFTDQFLIATKPEDAQEEPQENKEQPNGSA
jgi:hypothetical protein